MYINSHNNVAPKPNLHPAFPRQRDRACFPATPAQQKIHEVPALPSLDRLYPRAPPRNMHSLPHKNRSRKGKGGAGALREVSLRDAARVLRQYDH